MEVFDGFDVAIADALEVVILTLGDQRRHKRALTMREAMAAMPILIQVSEIPLRLCLPSFMPLLLT